MFNPFGALFDLYDAGQASKEEWEANKISIRGTLDNPILWKHWCGDSAAEPGDRVAHRSQYQPKFRKESDGMLPKTVPETVRTKD
jgi:hypothetical protein